MNSIEHADGVSAPSTQQLLSALKRARIQLEENHKRTAEPIAIVGMGCRFPGGANSPAAFWQLLHEGRDAIDEVPPERWDVNAHYDPKPGVKGKMYTRWGGFLPDIAQFDAAFFGLSARAADYTDPQQRLLLEVSWEALEHAAIAPDSLAGSRTGVFVGVSSNDYARLLTLNFGGLDDYLSYTGTGNAFSILANRLSYFFDFRGPSMALDTACSSSLVAAHQACQSLRSGECDVALAGGVNAILTPELSVVFSMSRMMAADGRCKTFDAAADGYVRSEGAGMLVLKRLSDAQRDGDTVLAVIAGSALNQDGRSNGITAPNGPAQHAVIQQALRNAGVQPAQVSFVETHGTGTPLGDPIEVNTLRAVLMENRAADDLCWLGAVKANIGHLESAAGVASLIKTVLCLQHNEIPAQLHLNQINPAIDLADSALRVPTTPQPWAKGNQPRYAGVSGFGFGGANAHLLLTDAPTPSPVLTGEGRGGGLPQHGTDFARAIHVLTLSARTEAALTELTAAYAAHLEATPNLSLADVCFTSNTTRNHFTHRAAFVAKDTDDLRTKLELPPPFLRGRAGVGATIGAASSPTAFLFTGQGAQYAHMGHELYAAVPRFRQTLDECDAILRPLLGRGLLEVLADESAIHQTANTQPALFALEYALAQVWQNWGVIPDVVMGHSVGELAAACVAGAFSLQDGLRLVAARGRLMQALPADGAMLAVFADEATAQAALQPHAEHVSVAAVNGEAHTVLSGDKAALTKIEAALYTQGIESRWLQVSHAFHSPLMEPMLDAFECEAATVTMQPLRLPLVTNLTGEMLPVGHTLSAAYWRQHAGEAVQFVRGLKTVLGLGCNTFIEIGPKPVLTSLGKRYSDGLWLHSLDGRQGDMAAMLEVVAALYANGATLNWQAVHEGHAAQRVVLPTYRFQRQRHWLPVDAKALIAMDSFDMMKKQTNMMVSENTVARVQTDAPAQATAPTVLTHLRNMLAHMLRISPDQVDIHAPLIEMGADSITLVGAQRHIEETFKVSLSVRQFFEELNTLETLAAYVQQHAPTQVLAAQAAAPVAAPRTTPMTHTIPTTPPNDVGQQLLDIVRKQLDLLSRYDLTHANVPTHLNWPVLQSDASDAVAPVEPSPAAHLTQPKRLPLTEAQQQLWLLAQLGDESSTAYSMSYGMHLKGVLRVEALRRAVQLLVDRHEALRTVIGPDGDVQIVLPTLNMDVPVIEFTNPATHEADVAAWYKDTSSRTMDMAKGPLFLVSLLKLASKEHVLVITAHHIVIDGLSIAILVEELSALYTAECQRQPHTLPAPVQFAEFVQWHQAQRNGPAMQAQEAFWLKQFPDAIPVLELPLDRPRPPMKTYVGGVETLRIDAQLTRALNQLSRTRRSTLFMTMLSAYMALLHRLSGQDDVVVGVPGAGRGMPGGMTTVGYLTHLLPIRSVLDGDPAFADLLQTMRNTLLDVYENQDYPFARLINKLNYTRDASLSPVVSTTFNLQHQGQLPTMPDLKATVGARPINFVDSELAMTVLENDGQMIVDFEYNRDLFDASTVRRIAGHFESLLRAIVEDASQHLSALPLLSDQERHAMLVTWNQTDFAFDATQGLHELFESQVAQTPDAIAVRFEDKQLTYTELNAQANGLAHQFAALGVKEDVLVAVLMDRSPDFMSTMLGLFKAGGAYLPLDVRAPASRYAQILLQSQAPILVISESYADVVAEALTELPADKRPRLLRIEDLNAQITDTANLPTPAHEDVGQRLAYVIYTSGSTGLPKGAMVEQRGMINHLHAKIQDLRLTAQDTVAQTAPQSFDISVWQFLSQLVLGGCVHIFADEIAGDPLQLLKETASNRITILEVVPSLLRMMLEEAAQGLQLDLSALRWMIPTGEALPPSLARRWLAHFPHVPLLNAYGPTECSDDVTHYAVTTPPSEHIVNMSIGKPVVNMRMYVLDPHLQPVPIGVAGELYVGGIGVGRGYIYDAERTALAFVPDVFSQDKTARLYKTGDKARYLPDGNIEYLGRLDFQVKIRGFRIELGEIEAVLEQHPAVKQCVVVDKADRTGNKKLVAYAVLDQAAPDAHTITPAELRRFMNGKLPDYMVPSAFVLLDEMPLTPNGKVNRKGLPSPDDVLNTSQAEVLPPRTDTEKTIVSIWAEVLNVQPERVGINSDFFELGGHSLLATQVASRMRQAFRIEMPLRAYFNEPTIADLAQYVETTQWAAAPVAALAEGEDEGEL